MHCDCIQIFEILFIISWFKIVLQIMISFCFLENHASNKKNIYTKIKIKIKLINNKKRILAKEIYFPI